VFSGQTKSNAVCCRIVFRWRFSVKVASYRELIAWQKSVALVTEIYGATRQLPKEELYGLCSQIRRAAVSVPSNIAEGQGRRSTGEFKHFLGNAQGSLCELETQLIVASNLKYLSQKQANLLLEQCAEVGRILHGLQRALS
jgi:four helix bundle protein